MSDRIWLIWSNEHKCWWAPNKCGYFTTVPPAGRYTTEEALRMCSMRSMMPNNVPPEIMVPAPEYLEQLQKPPCAHNMKMLTRGDLDYVDIKVCRLCGLITQSRVEPSYSRDYPY